MTFFGGEKDDDSWKFQHLILSTLWDVSWNINTQLMMEKSTDRTRNKVETEEIERILNFTFY